MDGTCVAADLHLGLADALRRKGVSFPLDEEERLLERLEALIDRFGPETLVLDGDVLHEFGDIPPGLGEKFGRMMGFLEGWVEEVVLLEGSHDKMLPFISEDEVEAEYRIGDVLILHGDEEPGARWPSTVVMGHEHPAMEVEGGKVPCYLVAKLEGSEVVVLPSMNGLTRGVTVNEMEPDDFMSPILRRSRAIRPIIELEDDLLEFPALTEARNASVW